MRTLLLTLAIVFAAESQAAEPLPAGALARLGEPRIGTDETDSPLVEALALTPDGRTLVVGHRGGQVVLWTRRSGDKLDYTPTPLGKDRQGLNGLIVTPDGRMAVSTSVWGDLCVWDVTTRQCVRRAKASGTDQLLKPRPDGRLATVGFRYPPTPRTNAVLTWEFGGPTGLRLIEKKSCPIGWDSFAVGAKFSADGRIGFHPVALERRASFNVWDVASGVLRELPTGLRDPAEWDWCFGYLPSPDGSLLAARSRGTRIHLFDVATGDDLGPFSIAAEKYEEKPEAFSHDGRLLLTADARQVIRVYEVLSGSLIREWMSPDERACGVVFAPYGDEVFTGCPDGTVLIWGLASEPPPGGFSIESAWHDLHGPDARAAYRALSWMTSHPDESVTWLASHVKAVPAAGQQAIDQLIADLDSDDYPVREQATRLLRQRALEGRSAVRAALDRQPSPEARRRLELVRAELAVPPPAETLRRRRAVWGLERIGTSAARGVLRELAGGTVGAILTRDAQEAMERLERLSGKR